MQQKYCDIFNTYHGALFTTPRFTQSWLDKGVKANMGRWSWAFDNVL